MTKSVPQLSCIVRFKGTDVKTLLDFRYKGQVSSYHNAGFLTMQIPCHLKQLKLWITGPLASWSSYGCLIFSVLILQPAILTITSWVPQDQAVFRDPYDSRHKALQDAAFITDNVPKIKRNLLIRVHMSPFDIVYKQQETEHGQSTCRDSGAVHLRCRWLRPKAPSEAVSSKAFCSYSLQGISRFPSQVKIPPWISGASTFFTDMESFCSYYSEFSNKNWKPA